MNISKLLEITALCCIGVFSSNNNIVNASEDEMDIDSDIEISNNATNNKNTENAMDNKNSDNITNNKSIGNVMETENEDETEIDNTANDLVSGFERININDTEKTRKLKNLIFYNIPNLDLYYDNKYYDAKLIDNIEKFGGIILSNGCITYYFMGNNRIKVFFDEKVYYSYSMQEQLTRSLLISNTIEELRNLLGKNYEVYKAIISDNGSVIVQEYK